MILTLHTVPGCEFECAVKEAVSVCKCIPWYLPNDFQNVPMCEMFGASCFDNIISDEVYYKKCSNTCLSDCKGISYSYFSSYSPIEVEDLCKLSSNKFKMLEFMSDAHDINEFIEVYKFLNDEVSKVPYKLDPEGNENLDKIEFCKDYVRKYVSFVTIEALNNEVLKSYKERRVSFTDQLATIGGTLGLFSGSKSENFV